MLPFHWVAKYLLDVHLLRFCAAFGIRDGEEYGCIDIGFYADAFGCADFGQIGEIDTPWLDCLRGGGCIHAVPLVGDGTFAGGNVLGFEVDLAVRTIDGVGERLFATQGEINHCIENANGGVPVFETAAFIGKQCKDFVFSGSIQTHAVIDFVRCSDGFAKGVQNLPTYTGCTTTCEIFHIQGKIVASFVADLGCSGGRRVHFDNQIVCGRQGFATVQIHHFDWEYISIREGISECGCPVEFQTPLVFCRAVNFDACPAIGWWNNDLKAICYGL